MNKPLIPPMNRPMKPAGKSSLTTKPITSTAAPKAMNAGSVTANGGYGGKPKGVGTKVGTAFRDMKF